MEKNSEFKAMIDLAFKRSTSTSHFAAQVFFEICQNLPEGRQKHKDTLQAKSAAHRKASKRFAVAAGISFATWLLLLLLEQFLDLNLSNDDTPLLVTFVGSIILFGFALSRDSRACRVEEELDLFKPLSVNPSNCTDMMDLTMNAPLIKEYVQSVVSAHDELAVGDLKVARAMLDGIYKEEELLKGKKACQALHGLSPAKSQQEQQ